MDIEGIRKFYLELIDKQQNILSGLKKKVFRISLLRLIVFLLAAYSVYYFWENSTDIAIVIGVFLVLFLPMLSYHGILFKKKSYSERYIQNARNELKALDYDFSAFDGGADKTDAEHSFSLDLDIFGNRSFFQSINRTITSFGKNALADFLIYPLEDNVEIVSRQQSIRELSEDPCFIAHFRASSTGYERDDLDKKNFQKSFQQPLLLSGSLFWNVAIYVIPALYIILGILAYLGLASGSLFLPLYIGTFAFSTIPNKKVEKIVGQFDRNSQILSSYSGLFGIVEDKQFESSLLSDVQGMLGRDRDRASKLIARLNGLYSKLMMSQAYPILLLLNPVLLWNVHYAIKVEGWTRKYGNKISGWFGAIGTFDALASLGIFAFNHPDYSYPIAKEEFIFTGRKLGHPLIKRDICVRNDIDISSSPYFLVITGANMAGKSTYLRTIGINHTLACAGAPVCAESLEFYPGRLVTNLRTADSLADNESYFFAELKRLKMIIDRLESGEELFIILDEILKGTNSIDKQKGSLALIKQFIALRGNGIIATHDLVLGTLEKEYPANIKNFCFEADIKDGHLSFTYKIREGIAQNMNASFLMKQMGITGLE